jgi:SAM-dependent methyltransferase
MTYYPCPIDFATAWHDCTAQDPHHRGDAATDLAFWQEHASGYDERARTPGSFEQTLAAIGELVRPGDTLLDVGAGTGRFAVPLASQVQHITALDHAAPMLDVLRARLAHQAIHNVRVVEAAWEDAMVDPHDVVLAAWSLYRLPDILAGVRKLVAATRRTLIIVAGAGHSLRHDPLLRQIWPDADEPSTPLHIYFHGVLWQAGVHADLRVVTERRRLQGKSPRAIARQLAPDCATKRELAQLAESLTPHLVPESTCWRYDQPVPVGLLVWQKHQSTTTIGVSAHKQMENFS